ncbi:unnamed protein product, partial [marine sediment metagenome]
QKLKDFGCELHSIPEDVDRELCRVADEFYAEKAAVDPLFAEILNSQNEFRKSYEQMSNLETPLYKRA